MPLTTVDHQPRATAAETSNSVIRPGGANAPSLSKVSAENRQRGLDPFAAKATATPGHPTPISRARSVGYLVLIACSTSHTDDCGVAIACFQSAPRAQR